MSNLINIRSIPIQIEIRSNRGRMEQRTDMPQVRISRSKGGLSIQPDNIRVKIDSLDSYRSMNMETPIDSVKSFANEGMKFAYQGTARIVEEGNALAKSKASGEAAIADVALNRFQKNIETMLDFIPSVAPNISWEGGTLNIQFQADDLHFDAQTSAPQMEFIPGNIELTVNEYPRVIIEYIGEPIYMPTPRGSSYSTTV